MPASRSPSRTSRWVALAALGVVPFVSPALASDHNEPAPEAVWPSEAALDAEWDLSDLYVWYDTDTDNLNVILPWHPNQLPLGPGEGAAYSDQVLYALEFEDSDVFSSNERATVTFQYGVDQAGEWGILIEGLPGHERLIFDCQVSQGAVEYHFDAQTGSARTDAEPGVFSVGLGVYDDPFVFDIDGYNASLSRALNGEVGLRFDPQNDTFEGLNVTAVVLSIPVSSISEHWDSFDVEDGFKLWATATVTDDYDASYGGE